VDILLKISARESAAMAVTAANIQINEEGRLQALKQLASLRDPEVGQFLARKYLDPGESPVIRSEAAQALGMMRERALIPALFHGLFDPEDALRKSSARALSYFPEEDTRKLFLITLRRIDETMGSAVVRVLTEVGWKPVNTLIELTRSPEAEAANVGIELLIGCREQRAVDLMLLHLDDPGQRDLSLIIAALGSSGDPRAVASLSVMARDTVRRQGHEMELALALASLGDRASAEIVGDLINQVDTRRRGWNKLIDAYKKLVGM
jgi:hypothetical protein